MEPLNAKEVTVLWHGWLKKLGGFSKRWKRRYFVFLSTATGLKELRHYDAQRDVSVLLASTPKGVIAMNDATGVCCFRPPSPPTCASKRHHVFNRMESHDSSGSDLYDQKFAVLTPLQVHLLAFQSGREWSNASESQQGLSLLASLSAFYPAVEVLHSGTMSKKRERTGHSAAKHSMMSYWKRHFFVFLSSGDLLYFKDETLVEYHGRVDVRHAPTVRVTGERMLEGRRKEIGTMLMKFGKLPTNDRESCLVWIAIPPSKMFVLKLQENNEGAPGADARHELTASARKWLSLLLQGHAETKYTQLEHCISTEKFEASPEILSAVRAGVPDELRGAIWKGFSGAIDLQRRAELKQTIRKATKTFSIRSMSGSRPCGDENSSDSAWREFFEELCRPIDTNYLDVPENRMIFARLCIVAMRGLQYEDETGLNSTSSQNSKKDGVHVKVDTTALLISPEASSAVEEPDEGQSDSDVPNFGLEKHVGKGRVIRSAHSSEGPTASWESTSRRRLLIATSRFNPFSHPCPWKVLCLLLAYLDEESSFWVINSIQDVYLPGYFHGHRPALQVDIASFRVILEERAPTLSAHLNALSFPVDKVAERWFLSLFTSTVMPLQTVLRVWDAFFVRGVRILFGVGIALFQCAEDKLFRAKSAEEAHNILSTTERTSINADALFSTAFRDDLNLSWLSEERFDRIRARSRQDVIDQVAQQLSTFKDKLGILMQMQDQVTRLVANVKTLQSTMKNNIQLAPTSISQLGFTDSWSVDGGDSLDNENDAGSLGASLPTLYRCLRSLGDAIATLSSDLNFRQAHWLALSSQLAGYPLMRTGTRMTPDLQSWLIQVKEGKISGAGLDALFDKRQSRDDALFPGLTDQGGLYFGPEDDSSSLFSHKSIFQTEDRYISEDFLHAVVSTLKAACMGRLNCLEAANCSDWHGGKWLQSSIEYPEDNDGISGRSRATTRPLRRAVSNANKPHFASSTGVSRRANPSYAHQTSRNSLDDSVLRHQFVNDTSGRQSLVLMHGQNSSSTAASLSARGPSLYGAYDETYAPLPISALASTMRSRESPLLWDQDYSSHDISSSNSRLHQQRSAQYRRSEQSFQSSINSMMSCFSRFIRLENRNVAASKWELRERALLLEDDLLQSLKATEGIVAVSKHLY